MAAGRIAALAALPLLLAGNEAAPNVTASFQSLRSSKGMLRACLTRNPAFFPNCDKDPQSLKASIAATPGAKLHFEGVPSGDYALSILHDENSNNRLDTMLGIPKEGVGFSQNPKLRFSAPRFDATRFHVGSTDVPMEIRLQYFL